MNRIILFCKQYKHVLLPILYAPVYLLIFFYLEKKPVSQIHVIEMSIDRRIPFCEYFVIPYYLWFLYVAATVVTFVFLERKDYYKLCLTLGVGMTLFLIVSYVYPNGLQLRPTTFARDNFCVSLVKAMYATDTPTNVLPSIHVFNSLTCCMAILKNKRKYFKKTTDIVTVILTILIIMSTMLLKQHSVVDVVLATLMYTACYRVVYGKEVWKQNAFCSFLFTNR